MSIIAEITEKHAEITNWRQTLHQNPQIHFEETFASDFIAEKLESFGIEVHRNLAKTGLVGVLKGKLGDSGKAIGLRADMDALPMQEETGLPYQSQNPGCMHACGHDGHMAMLLGAAQYLAGSRNFNGTVYFIFQPAEEGAGGAKVMIDEGLFKKFPMQEVYGLHNFPDLPVGHFAATPGPVMACADAFEINVKGLGTHAALPHKGIDTVVIGSQIILALQTICSRKTNPLDCVVVSATCINAGHAFNIIPEQATIRGTVRAFKTEIQDIAENQMRLIAENIAKAHGGTAEVKYDRDYPPTINHETQTQYAAKAAAEIIGADNVNTKAEPSMGAEDFSFMLQETPGCFAMIGNGPSDGEKLLHNPKYNFNDEVIPYGVSYWAKLVEQQLV